MKNKNRTTYITYSICIFAIGFAFFTMITLLNNGNNNQERNVHNINGYHCFVVLSGSMQEEFPVGSLIVSKEIDTKTVKEGDIISYTSADPKYMGEVVTHKVGNVLTQDEELAFETYGTSNETSDEYLAVASSVLGKYLFTIPYIGYFIIFIQGQNGFLLFVILPLLVVFFLQLKKLISRLRLFYKQ